MNGIGWSVLRVLYVRGINKEVNKCNCKIVVDGNISRW